MVKHEGQVSPQSTGAGPERDSLVECWATTQKDDLGGQKKLSPLAWGRPHDINIKTLVLVAL